MAIDLADALPAHPKQYQVAVALLAKPFATKPLAGAVFIREGRSLRILTGLAPAASEPVAAAAHALAEPEPDALMRWATPTVVPIEQDGALPGCGAPRRSSHVNLLQVLQPLQQCSFSSISWLPALYRALQLRNSELQILDLNRLGPMIHDALGSPHLDRGRRALVEHHFEQSRRRGRGSLLELGDLSYSCNYIFAITGMPGPRVLL